MRDKIRSDARLVRTCVRRRNQVVRLGFEQEAADVTKPSRACRAASDAPPPASILPGYEDLPLDRYISLAESTNPMHRLWSDGRWLKLPLAHGCYWSQCQFCDTSLDYIRRYVPPRPDNVVDRMIELQRRTGLSGFHFTDEALAPALLKRLAERLIARRVQSVWWGNIRLESGFTSELARLLAEAGCVAVTGGLECATDRLLALMNKGITLRMAARACKAFTRAGILTHAYLMYDFPTQTAQEVSDGLEYVRQLFERGALHSAYWHRFALTCHSPIAANPSAFGIRVLKPRKKPERTFACNELGYELLNPAAATLPPAIGEGLRRAVYNYMRGAGLDRPIPSWFDAAMPRPKLNRDFVRRA